MVILELVRQMSRVADGTNVEVTVDSPGELELARRWCELTGNTLVRSDVSDRSPGTVTVRRGRPPDLKATLGPDRIPGARLWLYTNFNCNLSCDYCCVSSSPRTPANELGADRIARLVAEAADWGVGALYLTGGEPFLLRDIGDIVETCAQVLPTTMLTNGMLFHGRRLKALQGMPRENFALQISLDSATSDLHDQHRGAGSWNRAVAGIRVAQSEGFRVRVAATVSPDQEAAGAVGKLHEFLDDLGIPRSDQVVRPVAQQGVAEQGVQLTREALVPEITVTASGIFWHPVAATDSRALVTGQLEPLKPALDEVYRLFSEQWATASTAAALFPCA